MPTGDTDNEIHVLTKTVQPQTALRSENKQLSLLTDNDGVDYKVYVPTNKKYGHLGIKLYEKVGQQWKNAVEYDGNVGDLAPQDLLNYEEQFLVK